MLKQRLLLQAIVPFERARLPGEIVAGITLAALAIPEAMGYASIAGMPVITGLYTLVLPALIFALAGSSRHLVVGADSATAAILAAGLFGLAQAGSPQYVALAGMCTLIVAGLLLAARVVRLGFLADFLSRSVLIGFLTGVGAQVAIGQLPVMLGVRISTHSTAETAFGLATNISDFRPADVAISLAVMGVVVGVRFMTRRLPGALLAVVGAVALGRFAGIADRGVALIGSVPGGLPSPMLPSADLGSLAGLLPMCLAMFFVILTQSAATSYAYAARYDERVDEDMELVALGLANLGAGLSGAFVVNGSPTKTQMVDSAGGRTQTAQIAAAVVGIVVLLFLTSPLQYLPQAALAAIVFLIGIELMDIRGMRNVLRIEPAEFLVATVTAAAVLAIGVQQAIVLAMALSLLEHVRQGYKPVNRLLVRDEGGHWQLLPVDSGAQAAPGLLIYRFNHSMYYANAPRFLQEAHALTAHSQPAVRWFCVDADAVDAVDFSACMALLQAEQTLQDKRVRLVFASVAPNVRAQLDRAGITAQVGQDGFFPTLSKVLEAYAHGASSPR